MNRLRILTALDNARLGLSLSEAIVIANTVAKEYEKAPERRTRYLYDLTTFDGRIAFAKDQGIVMDYINAEKKIQAIKELRGIFANIQGGYDYSGLREVKDVVDVIYSSVHPNSGLRY